MWYGTVHIKIKGKTSVPYKKRYHNEGVKAAYHSHSKVAHHICLPFAAAIIKFKEINFMHILEVKLW